MNSESEETLALLIQEIKAKTVKEENPPISIKKLPKSEQKYPGLVYDNTAKDEYGNFPIIYDYNPSNKKILSTYEDIYREKIASDIEIRISTANSNDGITRKGAIIISKKENLQMIISKGIVYETSILQLREIQTYLDCISVI